MESYEAPTPFYADDEATQWWRSGYAKGWNACLAQLAALAPAVQSDGTEPR